jgi:hypothetical protein
MHKLTKKKFEEFLEEAFKDSKPPEEMWVSQREIEMHPEAFKLYRIRKTDQGLVKLYKMK